MPKANLKWHRFSTCDLITKQVLYIGDGYRAKNSEMGPTGLPFARAGNINGGFLFDGADLLDEANVPKAGNKVSIPADIVFTSKGTVGRFAFVRPSTPRFVYSPQLCFWRVMDSSVLDARFLLYWMQSSEFLFQVQQVKGLTDMADYVSLSDQRRMKLTIPPLPVQSQIASILSVYDDLIENNTRRIKILEAMAQILYREWFVKFRFPGHGKVPIVESELGPIPERWRVGRLDDLLVLQRGFDLPTAQRISGAVPIIAATGLNGTHNVAKVKGPGVVTGRSGSLGTVMLVWEDFWPLNTALWVKEFRASNPIHAYFTLQALDLKGFNSGAAVPTLNRNDIHGFPTVLPDTETLNVFNEYAIPLFTLKRNLETKNNNLRTTRDLLLPKLVSGEIPVEAAAELTERTA
jgi:type I restriction enzyme S subunit